VRKEDVYIKNVLEIRNALSYYSQYGKLRWTKGRQGCMIMLLVTFINNEVSEKRRIFAV
jgi:hypothetical protein